MDRPSDIPVYVPEKSTRFMDQLHAFMRFRQLSYRTEQTYVHWILKFIRFHNKAHPLTLDERAVESWLTHLATERHNSVATQRIALNAIVFLYRQFLRQPLEGMDFKQAKQSQRIPSVLSHTEARTIIDLAGNPYRLMFSLMYGSGLRQAECLSLRVLAGC